MCVCVHLCTLPEGAPEHLASPDQGGEDLRAGRAWNQLVPHAESTLYGVTYGPAAFASIPLGVRGSPLGARGF